jgi:hypothetical protein
MCWLVLLQLLEVRERQEQRQRDIKAGLAGNPFASLGMTVADVHSTVLVFYSCLSSWLAWQLAGPRPWTACSHCCSSTYLRDAPKTSPIPSRPVDERLQCPVLNAIMLSVKPENDEERPQLAELGVLLRDAMTWWRPCCMAI